MNTFYDENELKNLGLKSYGTNVLISRNALLYQPELLEIGSNVRIDDFTTISGRVVLGSYIHIAAYTALYGGSEGIYICDFANLSSRVSVYSVSDDYSGDSMTSPMIPDAYKHVHSAPVFIGRHVIIGSTSVVLPGCRLNEGSAFGAFSLIKNDSEAWSINTGIPCRKVKDRSQALLDLEAQFLREQE